MSGASTAFLDGHIGHRDRDNTRRRDLDLHEILAKCSEFKTQEDRIKAVQNYSQVYPEFKYFLIVAYFMKNSFSELTNIGPIEIIPNRINKGQSVENLRSTWRQVCRLYNSFPSGIRIKRSVATQLLSVLYIEDAKLLLDLFNGKFYSAAINEEVVRKAFPLDLPKEIDPNA